MHRWASRASAGSARWARIPRFGIAGNAWHPGVRRQRHGWSGLEGDLWRLMAGSVSHGTVSGTAGMAWLFTPWQSTAGSAVHHEKRRGTAGMTALGGDRSPMAWQATQRREWPHVAHHGRQRNVGETSHGRHGVTSSGEAGSARSRWRDNECQGAAGKASPRFGGNARRVATRQARCSVVRFGDSRQAWLRRPDSFTHGLAGTAR